jgi:hypothetical protein
MKTEGNLCVLCPFAPCGKTSVKNADKPPKPSGSLAMETELWAMLLAPNIPNLRLESDYSAFFLPLPFFLGCSGG